MMVNNHYILDTLQKLRGGRQMGDMGIHHKEHWPFRRNIDKLVGGQE